MVKIKSWIKTTDNIGVNSEEALASLNYPLDTSVQRIKEDLSSAIAVNKSEIEIIYCGRLLADSKLLREQAGVTDNSTLHVVRKVKQKPAQSHAVSLTDVEALVTSFQTALMDSNHRMMLFNILSNPEGLSSLISATPGLTEDTVAQGVLKDPFLLMHWLTNDKVTELVKKHPSLVEAGQQLLSCLHADAARGAAAPGAAFVYDDDDDDASETETEQPGEGGIARGGAPPQITPDQLAAALAAAAAATGGQRDAAPPPQPSGPPGAITADMFRQAMMHALPPPAANQGGQFEEGMQQLRDMGFVNEAENRRVLQAAGGNFEVALELIIAERERNEEAMGLD